jgi:uracil-DNA glycosylase family 4
MRWTERQRAMLREIGVRLWSREPEAAVAVAAPAERAEAPAALPARAPAAAVRTPTSRDGERAPASAAKLLPADWLVVGEALDAGDPQQEQLLDNMLRAIGVARAAPARARRATYLAVSEPASSGLSSTPSGDAALAAVIEVVAPRCIVALGRAGAAAVLGSDAPLANWRGRCHAHASVPVVVTFSPAFLLRHPADKAKAWADLCLAVQAIATPA